MTSGGLKKILVTGGSGMIGSAVLSKLLERKGSLLKTQVRDRLAARAKLGKAMDITMVEFEQADFTRVGAQEMQALTKDCDTVIHCAGLVHNEGAAYQEYEVVNVRATQLLAEACMATGVKTLIFLSTSAVYGKGPFKNIEESTPPQAKTPYAVSKVTSENYLQSLNGRIPRVVVLRPSLVFGEGDRGNMLSLIKQIQKEEYVHVSGGVTPKSLIYCQDLADAILLAEAKAPAGFNIYNVANPSPVSTKELVDTIAEVLGVTKKFASVPEGLLKIGAGIAKTFMPGKAPVTPEQIEKLATETTCSIDKFVQTTGFTPRTALKKGIANEVEWARAGELI